MNEETKVGGNTENELASVEDTSSDTEHRVEHNSTEVKISEEETTVNEGGESKDLTCENREQTEQVQSENAKTKEDDLDLFDVAQTTSVVSKKEKILSFLKNYADAIAILILLCLAVGTYFNEDILFIWTICSVLVGLAFLFEVLRFSKDFKLFDFSERTVKEKIVLILGCILTGTGFIIGVGIDSIYIKLLMLWSFLLLLTLNKHIKCSFFKKGVVLSIYGLIILLGVLFYSNKEYKYSALSEADRVQSYINAFTSGNYSECDKITNTKSEKLLPEDEESVGTFTNSMLLYESMLDDLGECIESVKYDAKKDTLSIKYKQYKKIKVVSVDTKVIDGLVEKYVTNQLADTDLQKGIEDVYIKSFDNLNQKDKDTGVHTQKIKVSVKGKSITGLRKGITELLEKTNISHNVGVFENDIKATINAELRK